MPVNNTFQIRKGTSSQWSAANPVLASGEPGYDLTNNVLKIGDGVTPWNSLSNHKHSVSDITNFNSAVSGLLPTISNSGDNRLLTSTGSSVGINAENNLTFDSSTNTLNIGSSGSNLESTLNLYFNNIDSLRSNINFKDQFNNTQLYISSNADDGQSYIESPNYSLNINGPNLNGIQLGNNGALWIYAINNAEGVTINGSNFGISNQIADTIAAFSGINKHIVSLPTGTYPSLTELSYVKGATSNIQTQLNNKASVSNPGTNRLVTNNGTTTGLSAQSSLTFDGSLLNINGSGYFSSGITTSGISKIGGLTTYLYSDGDFITIRNSNGNDIYSTEEGMFRDSTNQSSINYINRELIDISGYTILSWGENRNIGIKTNIPNYTLDVNGSGNFGSGLYVNNIPVSISGHSHTSSDISDFNSAVSGLIPVKNIVSGTGINVSNSSGIYTINSTVSGVAESASLVTNVFNKTANTINKGSVVYINGGQGDQPTIQLAIASTEMGSSKTYGIVQSNIPSMSVGKVVVAGALTAFNTDQYNPTAPHGDVNGTTLWLSPSVSGAMTTTKPSAPYHMVSVGTIVRTHQNEGVIEVRVQNGFELEELHNVAISGVTNGQFLQYNGSGLWVPSSSGNFTTFNLSGSGIVSGGLYFPHGGNNYSYIKPVGNNIEISAFDSINFKYGNTNVLTTDGDGPKTLVHTRLGVGIPVGGGIDDYYSLDVAGTGNFREGLLVNGTGVSLNGHTHTSSEITNFNSSVSGLLPVTNITGGSNITVSQFGTIYTVAVTGSLGLTTEEVDDRVSNLLVAGTGIGLNYDDNANTLTIAVSGLSSTAKIGDGISGVITYNLSDPLNIVGSGSTSIDYNNISKTVTIGSPSLIREYELISSTKSAFTVTGGYALNNLDVYHNGIKLLASGDYTATNGSTFDLIQPAVSGDVVEWLGYSVVPRHQLILGEVRSDTVGNINYLGRAVAGSPEASGVWTIKRYTVADNGIDITTATASNAIWNNRLTETYL